MGQCLFLPYIYALQLGILLELCSFQFIGVLYLNAKLVQILRFYLKSSACCYNLSSMIASRNLRMWSDMYSMLCRVSNVDAIGSCVLNK